MQRTMRKSTYVFIAATGICCLLVMQWRPDSHLLMAAGGENLTNPLPGLTEPSLTDFNKGLDEFEEKETVEEGLGPVFNGTSCAECHSVPSVGGSEPNVGVARETRIGRRFNGRFDPLDGSVPESINRGGALLQQRAINLPACKQLKGEVVPQEATIVSLRNTTALFGLGLVEAIPEATIRGNTSNGGAINLVLNPDTNQMELGRFGWKAQVATLHQFAGDAYLNEMGITNPSFPHENLPQGEPIPPGCDLKPEPPAPAKCDKTSCEDDGSGVTAFANFMKFLAPAPRRPITDPAQQAQVQRGEQVFSNDTMVGGIECARCHVPTMTTGSNDVEALNGKPVNLYSDLLLHDIGTDDGIEQGLAKGTDFRTALLWGLSRRDRFMHDAKSNTIEDAILRHGGQAQRARELFEKLPQVDRAALLAFLDSL
jgi:CxxC motif-containing protein (DUF1111 family)